MKIRFLAISILLFSFASEAIVIRHDIDDKEYKDLATRFNSTVSFVYEHKGREVVGGTGTLIGNNWVLTAAHVANNLKVGDSVSVAGKHPQIQKIVVHPKWQDRKYLYDIALVLIENTPSDMQLAQLYSKKDEAGLISTFVGRGNFGNGVSGILTSNGEKRAAKNKVENAESQWLTFKFDQGLFIIGVSSWQNTESTNWVEGLYGVIENYSRVSFYHDWIKKNAIISSHSKSNLE